ncbi:MAG: hypothetical protein U0903_12905 [Planctomycetales bacterium]
MTENNILTDAGEHEDPIIAQGFRFFCRHFIGLTGAYVFVDENGKEVGERRCFVYSGFVLSIKGRWMIATAGHILKTFDENADRIWLAESSIIDSFGDGHSKHSIPFNLKDAPKFYRYDKELGVDFGLIMLNSNVERLLQANNIVPIDEQNWINLEADKATFHILIGLPTCFQDEKGILSGKRYQLSPAMLIVNKLDPTPDNIPQTEYSRFVGQIDNRLNFDILGMSGGPIIGFSPDRTRYWVVAIQSGWLAKRKINFGCPIQVFTSLVEDDWEQDTRESAE